MKLMRLATKVNETAEITPEEQLIIDEVKRLMTQGERIDNMFKKVDQKELSEETQQLNRTIEHLVTGNITNILDE